MLSDFQELNSLMLLPTHLYEYDANNNPPNEITNAYTRIRNGEWEMISLCETDDDDLDYALILLSEPNGTFGILSTHVGRRDEDNHEYNPREMPNDTYRIYPTRESAFHYMDRMSKVLA